MQHKTNLFVASFSGIAAGVVFLLLLFSFMEKQDEILDLSNKGSPPSITVYSPGSSELSGATGDTIDFRQDSTDDFTPAYALRYAWRLNGETIALSKDYTLLVGSQIQPGMHEVLLEVMDQDDNKAFYKWALEVGAPSQQADRVSPGKKAWLWWLIGIILLVPLALAMTQLWKQKAVMQPVKPTSTSTLSSFVGWYKRKGMDKSSMESMLLRMGFDKQKIDDSINQGYGNQG